MVTREGKKKGQRMSWQYIAGFFDGEGSVVRRKDESRDTYILSICNTNLEILEKIRDFMGCGRIFVDKRSKQNPKHSTRYQLRINAYKDVIRVASKIAPFSFIKRELLEEAIRHNSSRHYARNKQYDVNRMKEMYEKLLMTQKEIGKVFGLSQSRVGVILRKNNTKMRDPNCPLYVEKRREIVRQKLKLPLNKNEILYLYFEKGLSVSKIAEIYGIDKGTIYGRFKEWNIKAKFRRWTKEEEEKLEVLFEHKTDEELARILNRTVEGIKGKRRKLGLWRRPERTKGSEKHD